MHSGAQCSRVYQALFTVCVCSWSPTKIKLPRSLLRYSEKGFCDPLSLLPEILYSMVCLAQIFGEVRELQPHRGRVHVLGHLLAEQPGPQEQAEEEASLKGHQEATPPLGWHPQIDSSFSSSLWERIKGQHGEGQQDRESRKENLPPRRLSKISERFHRVT